MAPAHSILRAARAAHLTVDASSAQAEALAAAAASAAASASRFGGSGAAARAAHAGQQQQQQQPGVAAEGAARSAGLKRPRGGALGAAVELAGGEHAPLVSARAAGRDSAAGAGRGWFDLPAPPLTTELRRELTILRNRNFLDPTRRYKTSREDRGPLPKYFQIGTVVEGATERRSATRAQRKPSLLASLQADPVFTEYASRTMENIRARAEGGGVAAYRAKKQAAGAAWKKQLKSYKGAGGGGKRRGGKRLY